VAKRAIRHFPSGCYERALWGLSLILREIAESDSPKTDETERTMERSESEKPKDEND